MLRLKLEQSLTHVSKQNKSVFLEYLPISLYTAVPVNTNPTEDQDVLRISVNNFNVQEDETSETHPYDKVKSNHGYSKIKKKGIDYIFLLSSKLLI